MLLETERDSPAVKRSSLSVEKQTLRVSAVAALLAFCMGLAFNFGGKSSSIDNLTLEVNSMRNSVETLGHQFTASDKDTSNRITLLEAEMKSLQQKVDDMRAEAAAREGHR
jgi:peptidoglycan hydrolase CwlO-like protein